MPAAWAGPVRSSGESKSRVLTPFRARFFATNWPSFGWKICEYLDVPNGAQSRWETRRGKGAKMVLNVRTFCVFSGRLLGPFLADFWARFLADFWARFWARWPGRSCLGAASAAGATRRGEEARAASPPEKRSTM